MPSLARSVPLFGESFIAANLWTEGSGKGGYGWAKEGVAGVLWMGGGGLAERSCWVR